MGEKLKVIGTEYNECLFRSRLEARWAVFFDSLGIDYDYELEGYALHGEPKDLMYLPNFFLPRIGVHAEVKPHLSTISDSDIQKIITFASDSEMQLLLIVGTPLKYRMHFLDSCNIENYRSICDPKNIKEFGSLSIAFQYAVECNPDVDFSIRPQTGFWDISYTQHSDYHDYCYKTAIKKTMQARFEHKSH